MSITVWHSGEDFARWFVANTDLAAQSVVYRQLAASDASQPQLFHKMPDHLKQILYLDAPDVIVEEDGDPLVSIEVTSEAGTGHNAFQRFSRIIAAVENGVPALYIYPEAKVIKRVGVAPRWDAINPSVFRALERLMDIHRIPALLFYFPSELRAGVDATAASGNGLLYDPAHPSAPEANSPEMKALFATANSILNRRESRGKRIPIIQEAIVAHRRRWMVNEWANRGGANKTFSPESATVTVPTSTLISYLERFANNSTLAEPNMLSLRPETVIYQVGGTFRADPYAGSAAALDYLLCRYGATFEDRHTNLVVAWGSVQLAKGRLTIVPKEKGSSVSADDFVAKVSQVRTQPNMCLLAAERFADVRNVPRYYMQSRYGCSFTKSKEIRVFAFFADALLFSDGAFWREG